MTSARILLIGKRGQVGWELRRTVAALGQVVAIDYPEVDLASADSIRRWVGEVEPSVIINAAAHTAVDKAESEPDLVTQLNGVAPGILAEQAKQTGALLVHYSTDYVYDGAKPEPYTETDPPNPLNAYGRSKLAGDRAIQAVDGNYLIFRLCWVYGARGSNFMRTIMRLASERDQLRVVRDQHGCPTWSRMIAEATALVLAQIRAGTDGAGHKGVYHLCASGSTSWHGFAEAIVASMPTKQCQSVVAIPATEYPTAARRPANSVLACGKLRDHFDLELPRWDESLRLVLEQDP